MVRLVILFIVAIGIYAGLRIVLGKRQLSVNQFAWIYAAVVAGLVLVYMGLTGRLHPLFALMGAALPFLIRLFSLFNLAKQLQGASNYFGNLGRGPSSGQKSELNTEFLAMVLDHDTGHMDGRILKGGFSGRLLSDLSLDQLQQLYQEISIDLESLQVLEAYLDRAHDGWQQDTQREQRTATETGEMTRPQAFEILGLEAGASREDILAAHRRLMQKVHPDRGGSNYLAAKINQAKDLLLGE